MHPFSLNEEEIKQVGGALSTDDPAPYTSYVYGEEGGEHITTELLGEEGDAPPPYLYTP